MLIKSAALPRSLALLAPTTLTLSSAQAAIVLTDTDTGDGPFTASVWTPIYWDFVNQTYSSSPLTGPYAFQNFTKGIYYVEFYASPYNEGEKYTAVTTGNNVKVFTDGESVSSADNFAGVGYGSFSLDTPFYIGFSFDIEGGTHYGWALFEFIDDGNMQILHEFAYESEAGVAIPVGAVPEPDQVAMIAGLAAGSAAAFAARRRRKTARAA